MSNKKCGAPVFFRYTWPGQDETFSCPLHTNGIVKVAEAIGMHLQVILLTPEQVTSCVENKITCSCMME